MKMVKTTLVSILAAGALLAATANATTLSGVSSSTNLRVSVSDGVATLYGTVDSQFEKTRAGAEAKKLEGVEEVRNYLLFTD